MRRAAVARQDIRQGDSRMADKHGRRALRFRRDGTFRILMISDFHGGTHFNPKLVWGIDALAEYAEPDLVLLGGDQAAGRCFDVFDGQTLYDYLAAVLEPVHARGIPWAHVFGNHDREAGMSNALQQAVYERFPLCLSSAGPARVSGVGNYCLPVLSSGSDTAAYHIWALDSGREITDYIEAFSLPPGEKIILPRCFGDGKIQASPLFDQVMWYYGESARLEKRYGRKIPAVMFMHVPIIEFCLVARNPEECGMAGSQREEVFSSEMNSGLFMACLQRGDVKGIFCGHEHLNDFQGRYCGITLAYDSCVGYDMSAHDDLRGGRVIELHEDGSLDTRHVKLMELLGQEAVRDPNRFEGLCPP